MEISRRAVVAGAGLAAGLTDEAHAESGEGGAMYGLIGKMTSQPGQRDALMAVLIGGISGLPGCLSYIVAADPLDPEAIWVTEVWQGREAHAASLGLASVRDAITRGRPLIAGMSRIAETEPAGGHGLVISAS